MLRCSGGERREQSEEDADEEAAETFDQKGKRRHAVVRLLHLHRPSERHGRAVQRHGHRICNPNRQTCFVSNYILVLTIKEGLAENEEVELFVDACLVENSENGNRVHRRNDRCENQTIRQRQKFWAVGGRRQRWDHVVDRYCVQNRPWRLLF